VRLQCIYRDPLASLQDSISPQFKNLIFVNFLSLLHSNNFEEKPE
jgi:hypothetical protein